VSETKHSSVPWQARGTLVSTPPKSPNMGDNYGITFRRVAVCEPSYYMSDAECEANAEFIVRAVNSHYQLLEACKSLLPILEAVRYTAGLGKTQMERVEKARAAIALASNPHAAERE
jgi:hypothetical protein